MELTTLLPARSVEDILAQRVRLVVGESIVDLRVLSIEDNEAWKDRLDQAMTALLDGASDDDPGALLDAMAGSSAPFMELLESYDRDHVLPKRDVLRKSWTELDLLVAILEVWRAVNPLVDIGLAAWMGTTTATRNSVRPTPTSVLRQSTDGPPGGSVVN